MQGEEARGVVQGEERPAEHRERPRSHSDEWLTFCTASTPTREVDLEPLEYDLDLNKEVERSLTGQLPSTLLPHSMVASSPWTD